MTPEERLRMLAELQQTNAAISQFADKYTGVIINKQQVEYISSLMQRRAHIIADLMSDRISTNVNELGAGIVREIRKLQGE